MIRLLLTILVVLGLNSCSQDSDKNHSSTPLANKQVKHEKEIEAVSKQITTPKLKPIKKFNILSAKLSNDNTVVVKFSYDLSEDNEYKSLVALKGLGIASFRAIGNTLIITPKNNSFKTHKLIIYKEIKNIEGKSLEDDLRKDIIFKKRKPSVRFVGKGVILPNSKYLEIPIEATNVKSVKIVAFKVFKNNISQFLQENKLDGNRDIKKTGRFLWEKRVELKDAVENAQGRYSLDVTKLLANENGSLIRLTLYIDRSDSLYECSESENAVAVIPMNKMDNQEGPYYYESSSWDKVKNNYNYSDSRNPCKDSYYKRRSNNTSDVKNFLKSNIGIVAKLDANRENIYVATANIETAESLADVNIDIFNFQNQKIGSGKSKKDGLSKIKITGTPFYIKVKKDKEIGYLKVSNGSAIPTSQFDVGGTHLKQNINGFIYGERDVWRPGDKIFLTFVLDDRDDVLPKNYPVRMELFNTSGEIIQTKVNSKPAGDMYSFEMNTQSSSKTGKYRVIAYVGNQKFTKNIAIETVVPNRLKIELKVNKDILKKNDNDLKGSVYGQWLHGANAAGLKTDVNVKTFAMKTSFGNYNDYIFDDITREFKGDKQDIFSGTLDKDSKVDFPINLNIYGSPAGMLKAIFSTRIYEEGGNFSSSSQGFVYHPYNEYVGLKLPKGDAKRGMILTDKDHAVNLAMLDSSGKAVANKDISLTLHKISWKWWWDKKNESLAKYAQSYSYNLISSGSVKTDKNGQASWNLRVNYPSWGRYLVKACSKESKHCSSKVVYIDWPGWAGRAVEQNNNGIATLTLSSDKDKYKVGEIATVTLPKSKSSRLLVSIEDGTDILEQYWVDSNKKNIKIPITEKMAPNFYVSVTLLQPHNKRENDRPIRLMGVLNIMADNPKTHLNPILKMPDEVAPQKVFEIDVEEKDGLAMDYSLAIVDEGLLGLTNYKTPSLHDYFYQRKGLQVKTWDLYDEIVGAYSGKLERMLDVGGSGVAKDKLRNKKRRFEPVVKYLGTFSLAKNETKTHKVTIPKYIGAVRVMLVASKESKYAKAENSLLVRTPISLIATMPRVLHTDEEISVPVEVFVLKDGIKSVDVSVEVESEYFDVIDGVKRLEFSKKGEKITQLKLKTKNKIGKAKVTISAKSNKEITSKIIYIDISSINPRTSESLSKRLEPNEEWSIAYKPHGMIGTNKTSLELSTIPAMDLENRLNYLIKYPHGCIEQTTSSVFPQLYLSTLMNLTQERKDEIENNINAAIDKLQSFQATGGGLSYWPGQNNANAWGTNYAMHFLLEAKKKGFDVPQSMLDKLVSYQANEAQKTISKSDKDTKNQAYRLYVLAQASEADMSAMYRLKENSSISNVSKWLLSAAYASIGQDEIARSIVRYKEVLGEIDIASDETFASNLREQALILFCATVVKDFYIADSLAIDISNRLSSSDWLNTQAVAYSLLAMSRYANNIDSAQIEYKVQNNPLKSLSIDKSLEVVKLKKLPKDASELYFKNTGEKAVTVLISNSGISKKGEEKNSSNGLEMSVVYLDKDAKNIDITKIKQGSNFIAKVTVKNTTKRKLKNLVLSYKVPSGWQIHNTRYVDGGSSLDVDYQDIRDDRVYTYFSMTGYDMKEFSINLNASFLGKYYQPATVVESMYDNKISALVKGMKIEISK